MATGATTLRRLIVLVAASVSLAGCMTASSEAASPVGSATPGPAADSCTAAPAQRYIGTAATAAVGAELLRLTNSVEIRWVPPGTMVTMDYKFGRLTVGYDAGMKITSIVCS